MFTEQLSLEQLSLEQLSLEPISSESSSGAGPVSRPAKYGLEWGAFGLSAGKQASEAGPSHPVSCLDVGVMFDVCLPKGRSIPQNLDPQKPGGDFADVVPLHGDWVALFLGDACGQGAAADLAVPQALYSLRQLLSDQDKPAASGNPVSSFNRDPAHTLKRLNRHLCGPDLPAACASVSLSLAILNTKTGETRCASAGSEPPLILRSKGQIETISTGRVALGTEAGRTYRSVDFLLRPGDALLLVTDGVTQARKANADGSHTPLRYEGLTGLALQAFSGGGSPGRMAQAVLNGARAFAGGRFHDHASVLVAARR